MSKLLLLLLLTGCVSNREQSIIDAPYPPEVAPLEVHKHTGGIIHLARGKDTPQITQAKTIRQARMNCQSDIRVVSKKWVKTTFYLNYECL